MNDYFCLVLLAKTGESEAQFKGRLSAFWTFMLRQHPATFEKVYAETAAFEEKEGRLGRKYLIETGIVAELESQLRAQTMDYEPINQDEVYSKFEATPPEWFWIEH